MGSPTGYPISWPWHGPTGNRAHATWCVHGTIRGIIHEVFHERHHGHLPWHTQLTVSSHGMCPGACTLESTMGNAMACAVERVMSDRGIYQGYIFIC